MHRVNAIVCDKHKAALIYIHHWGKSKKESLLDRSVGSTAITAAVRHVLSVEQTSKYKREIKCAKSNIENSPVLGCIKLGNRIEIFEPAQLSEESQVDRGEKLLSELFADREQIPAYEIYRAGEQIGVLETSLKESKKRLGVESVRNGKTWDWVLSLGGNDFLTPLDFQTSNYPKLLDRQESESRVSQECDAKSVKSVKGVKGVKGKSKNTPDPWTHPSYIHNNNSNIHDQQTAFFESPPMERNSDPLNDSDLPPCPICKGREFIKNKRGIHKCVSCTKDLPEGPKVIAAGERQDVPSFADLA